MEINGKNCKSFGNGKKVMKLWISTLPFNLNKENKQTKWPTNLSRFMWEKLLNQKEKKYKVNE